MYYQTLGIKQSATLNDIKKAYRKLAIIYHPDKTPDDKKDEYKKKFQDITDAYDTLGDEQKRQQYDRLLSMGLSHEQIVNQGNSMGQGPANIFNMPGMFPGSVHFSFQPNMNIFEHIFQHMARPPQKTTTDTILKKKQKVKRYHSNGIPVEEIITEKLIQMADGQKKIRVEIQKRNCLTGIVQRKIEEKCV